MTERRVLFITTAFPPSTCAGIHRIVRFVRDLPEQDWIPSVLSEGTEEGLAPELAAEFHLPKELIVERTQALGKGSGTSLAASSANSNGESAPPIEEARHRVSRLRSVARNVRDLALATPDRDIAWTVPTIRKALEMVRRVKPHVVFTSGPPHSTHLIGLAVKQFTGTPWVADFRDPWARRPWGRKAGNPWGQRLLGRFENRCVRSANRVILNTSQMTSEFQNHYQELDAARFATITNGCDPLLSERIEELKTSMGQLDTTEAPHRILLCHPGSLYRKRDLRSLLRVISRLRAQGLPIELEQVGACDPQFRLEAFVQEHGLADAVRITPPIPHRQCLEQMAMADVFVLLQPGTAIQVPGKVFEMIAFGKPILALTDEGETADLIRDYDLGIVAPFDQEAELETAVRSLTSRLDEWADQQRWNRVRDDYDSRKTVEALAEVLNNSIGHSPSTDLANCVATNSCL